ncbi:MAG: DEAD/DEAH box helicase, partial [Spirochaetales bacterium]|nr:DEAD/DEAH box helicase [Spirochaetales bacterium]
MNSIISFKELGLAENILKAIKDKGYLQPTEIQQKAIPEILKGNDIIALSQTGTGKTASFTLPVLNRISSEFKTRKGSTRVLILVPTRELAIQVGDSVKNYGKYLKIKTVTVLGGVNINPQMQDLAGGTDILIATPGRLLDLYDKNAVNLKSVEFLVLDEADKLLDLGFKDELYRIIDLLPQKRETSLFSATLNEEIRELTKKFLNNPIDIRVKEEETTANTITEIIHPVDKGLKNLLLLKLFNDYKWERVLVFVNSQNRAKRLLRFLQSKNYSSDTIHGGLTQFARTETLNKFKNGKTIFLVA